MTALAVMLIIGTVGGLIIAALGHPKVYRAFFKTSSIRSLDH